MLSFLLLTILGCQNGKQSSGLSPSNSINDKPVVQEIPKATSGFAELPKRGIEIQSQYSRIQIKDQGPIRSMYFIRDSGQRVLESRLNTARPATLLVPYTRYMMAAHLLVPNPNRALIIGLGGGSMVHYLSKSFPDLIIDAVDIDPEIVSLAQSHFGVQPSSHVRLHAKDGFEFIADSQDRYDIIYMDAFLKPSEDTDATGTPLRLKTLSFYAQLRNLLNPNGAVAFNLNLHPEMQKDINVIDQAFGRIWTFKVPKRKNHVIIASSNKKTPAPDQILKIAKNLDKRHTGSGFHYLQISKQFTKQ